jgi:DnaJ-class molecular chaperone
MPNYYEILDVSKDATPSDIKKSYRSLSLKYHPDKPSGDKNKFQEINQAYEILSDPQKREQYDAELNGLNNPFARMNGMNEFNNIHEMFNMMFNGGGMPGMPGMHGMPPGMAFGGMPGVRIFHNGVEVNGPHMFQKPSPILKEIHITMEQSYNGVSIPTEIERWVMKNNERISERETIYITIPPGIDNNESLCIQNKGNIVNENCKGDLQFVVLIENGTTFKRVGLDLHYNKTITLKEALCGFSFEITHINGKTLNINNNGNITIIKPNYTKVIPNLGMKRGDNTGNLNIIFDLEFPDFLMHDQIEALKEIL